MLMASFVVKVWGVPKSKQEKEQRDQGKGSDSDECSAFRSRNKRRNNGIKGKGVIATSAVRSEVETREGSIVLPTERGVGGLRCIQILWDRYI